MTGKDIAIKRQDTSHLAEIERTRADVERAFAADAGGPTHNDKDLIVTVSIHGTTAFGPGYTFEQGLVMTPCSDSQSFFTATFTSQKPAVEMGGGGPLTIGGSVGVHRNMEAFVKTSLEVYAGGDVAEGKLGVHASAGIGDNGELTGVAVGADKGNTVFSRLTVGTSAPETTVDYFGKSYDNDAASEIEALDTQLDFSSGAKP